MDETVNLGILSASNDQVRMAQIPSRWIPTVSSHERTFRFVRMSDRLYGLFLSFKYCMMSSLVASVPVALTIVICCVMIWMGEAGWSGWIGF